MIPLGARAGIGAITIALAASATGLPAGALLGITLGGSVAALAGARRRGGTPAARMVGGFLAGCWLVVGRLVLGGAGPDTPPALPAGDGPWTALVVAVGTPRDGEQRLTVRVDGQLDLILAATAPRYPVVEPGDRVEVDGRPAAPPAGGYGDFLRRTGVAGTLRSRSLAVIGRDPGPASILERVRRGAGDALSAALPEPAAGLAAGILLGLRDRVDRDLAAAFTATGLSHVVAISGWNIALVAALVGALAAGRARRTRSGAIIVAIVVYTVLAGASASVVRAAAMAGVALLARETGRPGTAAAALGWAVALLVVASPANASDVGLQLSAAATAGLIAWSSPIAAYIGRRAPGLPGWIREGLGVSLAAQAATLPIVLVAFGRVAPLSPVLNLVVVPLVPLAMATGAVALAGGAVAALGGPPIVAVIAGLPGALSLGLLVAIVRLAATLPFANMTLPPALAGLLAALGTAMLAAFVVRARINGRLSRERKPGAGTQDPTAAPRRHQGAPGTSAATVHHQEAPDRRPTRLLRAALLLAALAGAVLVAAAATRPDGRVHVTVLDVGQGDAILVTGPTGGRMLVDGGPDPDRLLVALDARVPPWDRRLDLVVLTHPHEDHVGGLALVLERYGVRHVDEPGMPGRSPGYAAFEATIAARGIPSGRLASGAAFALDGIAFEVLWPDAAGVPVEPSDDGSEVNDTSIVLLGSFEGRRFLLTGDAQADVETQLAARGLPSVDLLKAGHHGSPTSSSEVLVAATRPRVAAISVGANNDYGHPSPTVISRLEAAGAAVLRTDEVGTIDVALGTAGVEVRTDRAVRTGWAAPFLPARAAFRRAAPRAALDDGSGRAPGLPYHRPDVGPLARGRRRPPRLPRPARVAGPARARRRGDRGLARRALRRPRRDDRPPARRGGRAPPRRRQGDPEVGSRGRAAPRRRVGRVAQRPRPSRARAGGRRAPRDPAPRARRQGMAGDRVPRGARRRLRRQARGPAPRVDGRPFRLLAASLPGGMEPRRRGPRAGARRGPGAGDLRPGGSRAGGRAPPRMDAARARRRPPRRRGGCRMNAPALGYYWGDDEYGLEVAAVGLGRRAVGMDGEAPATWRRSGAGTRAADIAERVATATLFGGGTLVIVEDPGPLVRTKAEREALLAAIASVAPGNALAFVEPIEGSGRRSKALEDLAAAVAEAGGDVRQVLAPREGMMARWIEDRASERGVGLDRGAAEALARKVGAFVREGDVDRRRQGRLAVAELEKLAVYRLDAPIRAGDVDALVADAIPGSAWAFLDAVGARKVREAAGLLDRLLEVTPEPVLVAFLHRRIRELLLVADHRERGETIQATARALKLKEFPARKLWEQGIAWRRDELVGALEGLLELDATLKGERGADVGRRRLAFSLWIAESVARD